jgi:ClpP class serine protease
MGDYWMADRQFLETYLGRRAGVDGEALGRAFPAAAGLGLFGGSLDGDDPGSEEAVNALYSLAAGEARIKISGPLSPEGPDWIDRFLGVGGTSYKTIGLALERAAADPGVKRVVLDMNTPGGTVEGADPVWRAVKDLAVKKPVEARVSGTLASARYYIASPCAIYAGSPTDLIGGIGVMAVVYDDTAALESEGIKKIQIVSRNAPYKNADPAGELGRAELQGRLDALERVMIGRIAEGRGVSAAEVEKAYGQGRLLVAADPGGETDAERSGMIDGLLGAAGSGAETHNEGSGYMRLEELVKEHPEAAAEIEGIKAAAREAGKTEGAALFRAEAAKAVSVLSGAAYPESVRAVACKVLTGESGVAALEAAQAVYDAVEERRKTEDAAAESAGIGATTAAPPAGEAGEVAALAATLGSAIKGRAR